MERKRSVCVCVYKYVRACLCMYAFTMRKDMDNDNTVDYRTRNVAAIRGVDCKQQHARNIPNEIPNTKKRARHLCVYVCVCVHAIACMRIRI